MLARSVLFFVLAGLLEIGGGYLMWLWLRERWDWWVGRGLKAMGEPIQVWAGTPWDGK